MAMLVVYNKVRSVRCKGTDVGGGGGCDGGPRAIYDSTVIKCVCVFTRQTQTKRWRERMALESGSELVGKWWRKHVS